MSATSMIRQRMEYHFPIRYFKRSTFSSDQEEYLNRYYIEIFKSFAIIQASLALLVVAVIKRKDPLFAIGALISSIGLAVLLHVRANDPTNLFKRTLDAIKENHPDTAIELIQKGASLVDAVTLNMREIESRWNILRFKQEWIRFKVGIVDFAIDRKQINVIQHLIGMGYDFSKSLKYRLQPLELAPTLEIAQLLIDQGALLSGDGFNVLERHLYVVAIKLYSIGSTSKLGKEIHQSIASFLKERCQIIILFLDKGLHLEPNFFNPWEKTPIELFNYQMDLLIHLDSAEREEIKDFLKQINGFLGATLKQNST